MAFTGFNITSAVQSSKAVLYAVLSIVCGEVSVLDKKTNKQIPPTPPKKEEERNDSVPHLKAKPALGYIA